ncbi:MAG: hypothetical protein AAGA76_12865 [Pseudomonadota bacterium]
MIFRKPDISFNAIEVFIFESPDLPYHWERLDAFEGEGYRRKIAVAETGDGDVEVSIYEVKMG